MASQRIAAFFDLDGTLVAVNSGRLWMRSERRLGRIRKRDLVQGTLWLAAYRFHAVNMDLAMRKALATIRGETEESLRQRTREWWRSEVSRFAAPGAARAIADHRERGHLLVLLSSSSKYACEIAAAEFGLDAFLCTEFEVRDGRFTGEAVRPVCYAEGKVAHAERFAAEKDVDLSASHFYSDSITDMPMFERVGKPCAVNPDLRLRIAARRRGWPILDWRR